jgi:hypothetical protein
MIKRILKSFRIITIDVVIYRRTNLDMVSFPDVEYEIQSKLISRGKRKYFIQNKGVLVHQSFLFNTVFLMRLIHKKGPVIGDCYTHPDFRGKSIYPFVIYSIAKDVIQNATNTAVFMIVNRDNSSSIKGIEKAGFQKFASIYTKRWLFFYFDKNTVIY